ncbi:8663_t:CDS:2, partial [Rhizophagus irregularis]
ENGFNQAIELAAESLANDNLVLMAVWYQFFSNSGILKDHNIKDHLCKVIKLVDVSYVGENGFNQAIELAAEGTQNMKSMAFIMSYRSHLEFLTRNKPIARQAVAIVLHVKLRKESHPL